MFIRFSVENFKSFNDSVVWSALADSTVTEHANKLKKVGDIELLTNIAIYGPNASGKTSLISAIKFLTSWLKSANGLTPAQARYYCRIKQENENKATRFIIQFSTQENIYTYDVSAVLSTSDVIHEKLFFKDANAVNSALLFERSRENGVILGNSLRDKLNDKDRAKWDVYQNDFNAEESRLFLAYFANGKKLNDSEQLKHFSEAYAYMTRCIAVICPDDVYVDEDAPYEIRRNEEFVNFLSQFDTGIAELKFVDIDKEKDFRDITERARKYLIKELEKSYLKNKAGTKMALRSRDGLITLEFAGPDEIICKSIKTTHVGSSSLFDYKEESDGTRRLFELMGMLLSPNQDKVYIVDEIDRSMHSQLTAAFIHRFNQINRKKNCQLFFTTHDTTLLNNKSLFRRDEVYFIERNKENTSRLYSVSDFQKWDKESLGEAYLLGRYGALPLISHICNEEGEEVSN